METSFSGGKDLQIGQCSVGFLDMFPSKRHQHGWIPCLPLRYILYATGLAKNVFLCFLRGNQKRWVKCNMTWILTGVIERLESRNTVTYLKYVGIVCTRTNAMTMMFMQYLHLIAAYCGHVSKKRPQKTGSLLLKANLNAREYYRIQIFSEAEDLKSQNLSKLPMTCAGLIVSLFL